MMDLTQKQWVSHVVLHPFEGFEDLRWKQGGSLKIAVIVVLLFFLSGVAEGRMFGFQFGTLPEKTFNVVPYLVKSVVLFAVWTVGNRAISTWLDGEGSLRNICIFSAYALIPYIAKRFVCVLLTHVLVREEVIFIHAVSVIGTLWTVVLLFMAVKTVHQYSFLKTVGAIALTLAAMLVMLFLLALLLSLFQQVYVFLYSVYTEIAYRIKV